MLYLERGDTLRLLPGVPRAWFESGKTITVDGMKSHFGALSFHIESAADRITARLTCASEHRPGRVEIRLPHPDGPRAGKASSSSYDAEREAVIIENFIWRSRGDCGIFVASSVTRCCGRRVGLITTGFPLPAHFPHSTRHQARGATLAT